MIGGPTDVVVEAEYRARARRPRGGARTGAGRRAGRDRAGHPPNPERGQFLAAAAVERAGADCAAACRPAPPPPRNRGWRPSRVRARVRPTASRGLPPNYRRGSVCRKPPGAASRRRGRTLRRWRRPSRSPQSRRTAIKTWRTWRSNSKPRCAARRCRKAARRSPIRSSLRQSRRRRASSGRAWSQNSNRAAKTNPRPRLRPKPENKTEAKSEPKLEPAVEPKVEPRRPRRRSTISKRRWPTCWAVRQERRDRHVPAAVSVL